MLCPKCAVEMRISATRYKAVNDDTAEKNTELFIEQDLICRNKACADYGKVIETVRNPIKLAKA